MALTPLAPTQSGMQIPGMATQPYPDLSPAQGGLGAGGAEEQTGGEMNEAETAQRLAILNELMMMLGMDQQEMKGFMMGRGFAGVVKDLVGKANKSRGITDEQTGVYGDQQQMAQAPPMPPGISATPLPPG